jgi:phospholipid/cholesterol/gamma-HCH transport system substrate-binding protein
LKISKEFKLGVLFLTTLLLLGWGISFLKGKNIFSNNREFYGVYDQVEGLLVANPVTVNGFEVGQVTDIAFTEDNTGNIIVTMEVKNDFIVPKNTVARIYSSDIMGSKAIALNLGSSQETALPGDTLTASVESGLREAVNEQVRPIKVKAENLLMSIDSVVTVVQDVFNPRARDDLAKSFKSISEAMEYLKSTTYNLDTLVTSERDRLAMIVGNLESITRNIDSKEDKINNVINNLSTVSDSIANADISTTLKKANQSIDQITAITQKLNEGQGSAGKLLNNDSLYNNLEAATHELNMLLLDMKLHPQRYVHFSVFGRGNKRNEYIPPEEKEKKE